MLFFISSVVFFFFLSLFVSCACAAASRNDVAAGARRLAGACSFLDTFPPPGIDTGVFRLAGRRIGLYITAGGDGHWRSCWS